MFSKIFLFSLRNYSYGRAKKKKEILIRRYLVLILGIPVFLLLYPLLFSKPRWLMG